MVAENARERRMKMFVVEDLSNQSSTESTIQTINHSLNQSYSKEVKEFRILHNKN